MLARCAGSGSLWRRIELALAVATVVALASSPAVAAVPLFGQGAAGLVAPGGVEQLAKPAGAAGQPAVAAAAGQAAGEAAATPADPNAALKKYAPSYALLLLVVGLGMFIVCRPSPRPATEQKTDKKSEKKKK